MSCYHGRFSKNHYLLFYTLKSVFFLVPINKCFIDFVLAHTSLSRSSHSTKTEVAKLRDMIHKLEKENQELQQQVKDKG